MSRKILLYVQSVEDGGFIVSDRVYPEKQYVFTNPHTLYEWICKETGSKAKLDSMTHDGRVVVDANKLDRLKRIEEAAIKVCENPYAPVPLTELRRCLNVPILNAL